MIRYQKGRYQKDSLKKDAPVRSISYDTGQARNFAGRSLFCSGHRIPWNSYMKDQDELPLIEGLLA